MEIRLDRLRQPIVHQDSVVEGSGLTLDEIPSAYREDILQAVRKGLEAEGAPVPNFLLGKREN